MIAKRLGLPGLYILGLILAMAVGYHFGGSASRQKAIEADNARLREAFEQGQAVGTVRDVVVTKYVTRERVVYKTGATITKEIPVYVTPAADAACTLTRGFVRVHDAAAANSLPGPAGPADGEPAGIALSRATGVIADNYTACHVIRERLISLQEWARETKLKLEAQRHE